MDDPSIVGIVLVKNEDLYLRAAVENILEFCDRIILCDNGSTDETGKILKEFSARHTKVECHSVRHPRESHEFLKPLAGTRSWVFGVDGDEIYDPRGLGRFRSRLLEGEFEQFWRMKGHALHCDRLGGGMASGFSSPPSRSITKLYNFSAISSWDGDTFERLHGGRIVFREGWNDAAKRNLQDEMGWEDCPLRCLHLCFLKRSSRESRPATRRNIVEIHRSGLMGRVKALAAGLFARGSVSAWKQENYRKGSRVTVDARLFFPADETLRA